LRGEPRKVVDPINLRHEAGAAAGGSQAAGIHSGENSGNLRAIA
jgi:hypothetical protein